jgi:hypothetical protein
MRDEASEWLTWVDERDRRLVILALVQRATGRTNVDWNRIKRLISAELRH